MATTTATPQTAAAPAKSGKAKRLTLIALIAVGAAVLAAGGTYFFVLKDVLAKPSAAAAPAAPAVPVFYPLESMTVNLLSDDGQHYLRVGLTLKLADEKTKDRLAEHMPEIRSRILLALSNKHPEDLSSLDGKHALAKELKTLVEQPTDAGNPAVRVEDVLFTEFVVQ